MSASHQPRSSPAHLVYKFGCGVQGILNLSSQLDAKQLSSRQRDRLRERLHELDTTLWPEEPRGDVTERSDTALAAAHATIEQLQKDLRAAQTAAETKAAGSSRGSLLNRIVIRPKEPSMQWSYDSLFSRYFPGVTDITIYEPYLSSRHQGFEFARFPRTGGPSNWRTTATGRDLYERNIKHAGRSSCAPQTPSS